ncbi:hypothetical protein FNL37_1810 [Methylovorus glucosotrophus]|uniref:hypothetical protein n=1 Tax=Methylovorus glucosotrophus TaxID=266009 RepID=UPI00133115C8|nr:hypothetical protein [Methylovorus glucosotrophus]KAF0844366.1 hypothetical protein FNL37_1810 [Methylovorus glucosotrophus]
MSEINTGGPAFPVIAENGMGHVSSGVTVRDYFAAKALQGLLPAGDPRGRSAYTEMSSDELAKSAYQIADAMIREREQQP